MSKELLDRARKDTQGTQFLTHLNNAGTSLSPDLVYEAQSEYLRQESQFGAYETANQYGAQGREIYDDFGRIFNVTGDEIGFCDSASAAFHRVIHGIGLRDNSVVAFDEGIYGNNLLALSEGKHRYGWSLRPIPSTSDGTVDLDQLTKTVREHIDLVIVTHVRAHRGTVNPLQHITKVIRENSDALVLIDMAQSLGQVSVDMVRDDLDLAVFTGRKYLRGPRGTGGFVIRRRSFPVVRSLTPDTHSARFHNRPDDWVPEEGARALEHWERNWSAFIGLGAAHYFLELDHGWAFDRITSLAQYLVHCLSEIPHVRLTSAVSDPAGIVGFDIPSANLMSLRNELRKYKINIWYTGPQNTPLQLFQPHNRGLLRASVHYYNTEAEIEQLVRALDTLT